MLNRHSDPAASRKGFALLGALLLLFGVAMALFEVTFIAVLAIGLALVLLLSATFCSHSAFARVERVLGRVFAGW